MELTKQGTVAYKVKTLLWQSLLVIISLFFFFFTISLISSYFKHLGKDTIDSILVTTANPYIGLFIGLLITAIIQSSSTSTSMIVAIVASGSLTLESAVPMILGANIGTTLTSSLVALSFVTTKNAFRRAISAGVIHDFFNIILTIIILPLELIYGLLSNLAALIGNKLLQVDFGIGEGLNFSFMSNFEKWSDLIIGFIPVKTIATILSFILLFISIRFLSWLIYRKLIGKSQKNLRDYLFKNNLQSFSFGLLLTSAIQSSSVSTSLIVPFVASRKVSLDRCYAFIVGSNLGTTLTALLAALFISKAAISVALIHLIFNFTGFLLLFLFKPTRKLPIIMAKYFGRHVQKYRYLGFAYVILIFFLIPFSLIYFT